MTFRQKLFVIAVSCFAICVTDFVMMATAYAVPTTMGVYWNMSAEDQAKLTFFRVINQNNEVVADNVAADARGAEFQTDGEAGAWRVDGVFVVDGVEYISDVSKSAVWAPECPECPPCPVDPVPPTPTVYNITGTITAQPVE